MTIPEKAAAWAEEIAADDVHGYDQAGRWGPDYDCSSLVITAYRQAGLDLKSTYTGNMRADLLAHGFRDVTSSVKLATGAGLLRGDVLLNERSHTAIVAGGGRLVHAAGNERGGAVGGRTGDQTGREIGAAAYYNFPWDCVLRYAGAGETPHPSAAPTPSPGGEGCYIVRPGDSLWAIAARELGDGTRWDELRRYNALPDAMIHPGQTLRLPGQGTVSVTLPRALWEAVERRAGIKGVTAAALLEELLAGA